MKLLSSKLFVVAILIGAVCCNANAQTTVKSITSEKKYTDKQIRAVLGNPDSYDTQKGIYGETLSYYYYKDAEFTFSDGQLLELGIRTNKYPVMTDKVSGGVKVGDNISKVKKIKSLVCQQLEGEKNCYIIGQSQMIDQPDYVIYVKNDIIVKILFVTLD